MTTQRTAGVGLGRVERGGQLVHQLAVQGVQRLGPVQPDQGDGRRGGLDDQGLVGSSARLRRMSAAALRPRDRIAKRPQPGRHAVGADQVADADHHHGVAVALQPGVEDLGPAGVAVGDQAPEERRARPCGSGRAPRGRGRRGRRPSRPSPGLVNSSGSSSISCMVSCREAICSAMAPPESMCDLLGRGLEGAALRPWAWPWRRWSSRRRVGVGAGLAVGAAGQRDLGQPGLQAVEQDGRDVVGRGHLRIRRARPSGGSSSNSDSSGGSTPSWVASWPVSASVGGVDRAARTRCRRRCPAPRSAPAAPSRGPAAGRAPSRTARSRSPCPCTTQTGGSAQAAAPAKASGGQSDGRRRSTSGACARLMSGRPGSRRSSGRPGPCAR